MKQQSNYQPTKNPSSYRQSAQDPEPPPPFTKESLRKKERAQEKIFQTDTTEKAADEGKRMAEEEADVVPKARVGILGMTSEMAPDEAYEVGRDSKAKVRQIKNNFFAIKTSLF